MWEFIRNTDFLLKTSFLVAIVYLAVSIYLAIFLVRNRKTLGYLRPLTIIVIASLIQTILTSLIPQNIPKWFATFLDVSPSIYTLIEFATLQLIFFRIIRQQTVKKAILFTAIIALILLAIFARDSYVSLDRHFGLLTSATSGIILITSFIGYYEIVDSESIIDLRKSYHFWFITAVFFFFSISLPLYFFNDYVERTYPTRETTILLTNIGTTYYTLFFLLLYKASKCKVQYQK